MNNTPNSLSDQEINELSALDVLREMWGAEDADEMKLLLKHDIYGVRFAYLSATAPGYQGDYFILQGDALGEPVGLIRGEDHKLKIV
jgi:hypothetical protein